MTELEMARKAYWAARTPEEEREAYADIIRLGGDDGYAPDQKDKRIAELEASMRHAVKIEDALRELVDAYKGNDGRGNSAERLDLAVRMAELVLKTQ